MEDINNFENNQNDETSVEEFLQDENSVKLDKIEITHKPQERRVHIEKHENNSGMGDIAPYSISRHFNWGTFLFNWIWGLKYKKFTLLLIPLVCILPYGFIAAIIGAFLAGTKGNQWAWEEVQYKNEADFHHAQKAWVKAWFILAGIALAIALPIYLSANKTNTASDESSLLNKDYYSLISTTELKIPQEIYDKTDTNDHNVNLLLSNKYVIYWFRPKNDRTIASKQFIEDEFERNKENLGDKYILYPDIKEIKGSKDDVVDLDIEASCINETCIDKWLYKTCKSGYCILNFKNKVYYKTRDRANVIPKALSLLNKWDK